MIWLVAPASEGIIARDSEAHGLQADISGRGRRPILRPEDLAIDQDGETRHTALLQKCRPPGSAKNKGCFCEYSRLDGRGRNNGHAEDNKPGCCHSLIECAFIRRPEPEG